jgi:hypothetical protein
MISKNSPQGIAEPSPSAAFENRLTVGQGTMPQIQKLASQKNLTIKKYF